MGTDEFFRKYNLALLRELLKDKDFNLSISLNSKVIPINQSIYSSHTKDSTNPRRISQEELERYVSAKFYLNDRWLWLSNRIIFEAKDIDFIVEHSPLLLNELSEAQGINWSDCLIEKYIDKWNWFRLSSNNYIRWTKERIQKFEKFLDFRDLSYNTTIEIDEEIISKYVNLWDWNGLSGNAGVIKNNEHYILNHSKTVWNIVLKSSTYESYNNYLGSINEIYIATNTKERWLKPCICTNPGIYWTLKKFESYKHKIDFWVLALYGNLDKEVIYKYGEELNENRELTINNTKLSDWYDKHMVYRNGWENLLLNKNVVVNVKLLLFLSEQTVNLIRHRGDAREGHTQYDVIESVNEIVPAQRLRFNFDEMLGYIGFLLPKNLITSSEVDINFYSNILKPAFLGDVGLVQQLIKSI